MNDPEKVSSAWVKHLNGLVDKLNDIEMQTIGIFPKDAIKLKIVNLVENYPPEDTVAKDGLYYHLLQPREEQNHQHKRTTDRIWSKKIYRFREVMEDSGNWVIYYLKDLPDKTFISEELIHIPEDTELPPNYVESGIYHS